ncbi:MAG TPA: YggT family protein [Steroidobacteraceae bacterium]
MDALLYVLNALFTLVVVAFLLRVIMPLVRADFRNPFGAAILKVTNPLVLPLRRVLPPARRVDPASIVALLVVQFLRTAALQLLVGGNLAVASVLVAGLLGLLVLVVQFYFYAILLNALLSWFAGAGYNPAAQVVDRICEPLLAPVRRIIPPLGGLDLSPLFVMIGLQALLMLLR